MPRRPPRRRGLSVDGDYSVDYLYYKVRVLGSRSSFLRLLHHFPPSVSACGHSSRVSPRRQRRLALTSHVSQRDDSHPQGLIRRVAPEDPAIWPSRRTRTCSKTTPRNAVLFEAINLIIHLDTEQIAMKQICSRLGRSFSPGRDECRYLGLEPPDAPARPGSTPEAHQAHQDVIIGLPKDRDIGARGARA